MFLDIGALLRRIPGREILPLASAAAFVTSPRTIEVEFPYGGIADSVPPSSDEDESRSKKRKSEDDTDYNEKGTKRFKRYSKNILSDLIIPEIGNSEKILLPKCMKNSFWLEKYNQLTSMAVSSSTWKSRLASFHKLEKFNDSTNMSVVWPLTHKIINGFVIWCFEKQEISAKTTKTYLTHLNSIQKFMGFKKFDQNKFNLKTLMKGFENGEKISRKAKVKRETIDFETLKKIKIKIFEVNKPKNWKKCFWAACSTAFFGCFRMGELLPKLENQTDKTFDLLWGDIKLSKKHAEITLKSQKNQVLKPQILHIFKLKDKNSCPISALRALKKHSKKNGFFSSSKPVFMVSKKQNLTQRKVNEFLKKTFKENKFSGHSFRAGVPSSLADFPNIANDWHVMGWGRWRSNIFLKYQNRTKKQSKWVFKKIEKCLL